MVKFSVRGSKVFFLFAFLFNMYVRSLQFQRFGAVIFRNIKSDYKCIRYMICCGIRGTKDFEGKESTSH